MIIGFLIALFVIYNFIYVFHFLNTISQSRRKHKRYGWGTMFLFYKLYRKSIKNNKNSNILNFGDNIMTFVSYGIYILFDPISFLLTYLFIFFWLFYLLIKECILNNFTTDLFKSYKKVESEKILDKLTE